MGSSENPYRDFAPVGNYINHPTLAKVASHGATDAGCGGSGRTQDLLQFHDCRIRSQPLMHGMILAGVTGIEKLSILVVVVVCHNERKCRAPAAERRSGKVEGGPIDGVGEGWKRAKL